MSTYTKLRCKKHVLKNGLSVLAVPMPHSPCVTSAIFVKAGPLYENKANNGISHLLEHMVFKGTKRRSARDLLLEPHDLGASSHNAYTGREEMVFLISSLPKVFSQALDLLSDIFLNSTFPDEELLKEKMVVLSEIGRMLDDPDELLSGVWFPQALYGSRQSAGLPICGKKSSVLSIDRNSLLNYQKKLCGADSVVVCVAGNIKPHIVFKEVETLFSNLPETATRKRRAIHIPKRKSPHVLIGDAEIVQPRLLLGCHGFPKRHKFIPATELASYILGIHPASRLYVRFREDLGISYQVSSAHVARSDHGYFMIYADVVEEHMDQAIITIAEEIKKLCDQKISTKELETAKKTLWSHAEMHFQLSSHMIDFFGPRQLWNEPLRTIEDVGAVLSSVTATDIQAAMNELFQPDKLALALIGPFAGQENHFRTLLSQSFR